MTELQTMTTATASSDFLDAFNATADDRAALHDGELLVVNLDVPATVDTVIAAFPRMQELKEVISAAFALFDRGYFDKIAVYARALAYAHTGWLAASEPPPDLPWLAQRGAALRGLLLADANALVSRGILDGRPFAELKGGVGYLNVASDLGVIARVLRDRWMEIAPRTAMCMADVRDAESMYEQITLAHAQRHLATSASAAAADARQRAFTLLVKAYNLARSQIAFVRAEHGDVDKIAPSLWRGRGGRGAGQDPSPVPTPAPPPPVAGG